MKTVRQVILSYPHIEVDGETYYTLTNTVKAIYEYHKQFEQESNEHDTCDGCAMFQNCGCMLDDSRPPCFKHSSWIPKQNPEINLRDELIKYITWLYGNYDSIIGGMSYEE